MTATCSTRTTIRRMGRHLRNILAAAAEDAERRVSALPLLDAAERERIVVGWNKTARSFPRDSRIETLFRAQARRTPRHTAVVADDLQLRYDELDSLSDQWADQLIRNGARPGLRIGLCLERSAAMIVAMLAVLKTGGAYVPLDPGQPPERLRAMIESVEPALVVVDRESGAGPADVRGTEAARRYGPVVDEQAGIVRLPGRQGRGRRVRAVHIRFVRRAQGCRDSRIGPSPGWS